MTVEGTQAPTPERAGTSTRAFLFADLRGYTAFVERQGARRAAAMLDRYRSLVRSAVAEFDGAEIRTEGDSFYVVFGSASSAIECGLAIVGRAEAAAEADGPSAYRVGVGIHAGETVESAEGYVGTAVNTAARICAQAGPNEVLVSGTVRVLTAGVVSARFVPVGRRRLKGLRDSIDLYRAMDEAAPRSGRSIRPGLLPVALGVTGAMALVALVVMITARPDPDSGGGLLAGTSGSSRPSTAPTASAAPSPDASGSLGASTGEFPNDAEAALLAKLDEDVALHCDRADDDDRPVVRIDPDEAALQGVSTREPVNVDAGLVCDIPSLAAPDIVHFWSTRFTYHMTGVDIPRALIINQAGTQAISQGDCAIEVPAYGQWALGDLGGWLLCRENFGDAVIEWSYDGSPIYGRAVRRDGDLSALLRWWTDHARLLRP